MIVGLPNWVWIVLGLAGIAGCVVILRTLRHVFTSLDELADSLTLSRQLIRSATREARAESEKAVAGLTRLREKGVASDEDAWQGW